MKVKETDLDRLELEKDMKEFELTIFHKTELLTIELESLLIIWRK